MRNNDLYQRILGLSSSGPVVDIQLDRDAKEFRGSVEHSSGGTLRCPEYDCDCPVHDQASECLWRCLDSSQFNALSIAAPPRVKFAMRGVRDMVRPWAEKGSRFTMLFERFAIDAFQMPQTAKIAQGILRTR